MLLVSCVIRDLEQIPALLSAVIKVAYADKINEFAFAEMVIS